ALLRQRRWRALEYHRRLAHRELRAPRHRAVGLSPRRAHAPAHLAEPPSPRAQPQALESDPREGRHSQAAPRPHAAGARRTSGTSVDVGADAVRDVVCRTVTWLEDAMERDPVPGKDRGAAEAHRRWR